MGRYFAGGKGELLRRSKIRQSAGRHDGSAAQAQKRIGGSMKAYYCVLASEDNNHEKPKRKENKKKLRDNRRDTRSSMKRKIGRRGRRYHYQTNFVIMYNYKLKLFHFEKKKLIVLLEMMCYNTY